MRNGNGTVSGVKHGDAGVMLAGLIGRERARRAPADQREVAAFCERLKGYTNANWADPVGEAERTSLPVGFRNVRVFDGRDGRLIGSLWHLRTERDEDGVERLHVDGAPQTWNVTSRPVTVNCVIALVLADLLEEVTGWTNTSYRTLEEGVLDLIVDIETRPRLNHYDGSPLDAATVGWIAARAPRRQPTPRRD